MESLELMINLPEAFRLLYPETVSHLEGLGVLLLLMDRDDDEAEDERQAEDHKQQDKAPCRQLQETLSKNNNCTE